MYNNSKFWYTTIMDKSSVGRKGALERIRLYGNPGTPEGRRKGGLRSLESHRKNKSGFNILRKVSFPKYSRALAELFGIIAGDGHIGEYQILVTTNSKTDREHALHIKNLAEHLFKIPVSIRYRTDKNACVVIISSKEVCRLLTEHGLKRGNKIHAGLSVPFWIRDNKSYRLSFVRGLFDTDGCVYIDTHSIRGRRYQNVGMNLSNRCPSLLAEFKDVLMSVGLHPTQATAHAIFLRKKQDIQTYFDMIGSSNPKHLRKVKQYFSETNGRVPKRS